MPLSRRVRGGILCWFLVHDAGVRDDCLNTSVLQDTTTLKYMNDISLDVETMMAAFRGDGQVRRELKIRRHRVV